MTMKEMHEFPMQKNKIAVHIRLVGRKKFKKDLKKLTKRAKKLNGLLEQTAELMRQVSESF